MRREKPSPPPVHDTCNFARSGSRVPREFRARCGIIKELPATREDSGQVFAAWIYIAAFVEDSAPILRGTVCEEKKGNSHCDDDCALRLISDRNTKDISQNVEKKFLSVSLQFAELE